MLRMKNEENILDENNSESICENICKRCGDTCDPLERPSLKCIGGCLKRIHVDCLKRGSVPGSFVGDVFFDLTCSDCESFGNEVLLRGKLSWAQIIILALYNLKEKSSGISKRGYFHWKSDVCTFIDRNWEFLCRNSKKQSKNWIGSISGTLSHNSGIFFKSGSHELGEAGYWKLITNDPPEILFKQKSKIDRKKLLEIQTNLDKGCMSPSQSESSLFETSSLDDSNPPTEFIKSEPYDFQQSDKILSDFLLTEEDLHDMDILESEGAIQMNNSHENSSLADLMNNFHYQNYEINSNNKSELINDSTLRKSLNQSSSQNTDDYVDCDDVNSTQNEHFQEESSDSSTFVQEPAPSLFSLSKRRPFPWIKTIDHGKVRPRISEREEAYLLQRMKKRNLDLAPAAIRRIYRKLTLRKLKREYSQSIFDLDKLINKIEEPSQMNKKGNQLLDRFVSNFKSGTFEKRLQGHCEPISVHSPYTNRLLKPFIRRDMSSEPLWLKLMNELCAKVNKNNPNWKPRQRAPIDYSYIRPQHIPALNSLCNQFFWPGIDLTECLQYPDFSCVVLYKKLVIGFAILIPDVGYNEAYVSFFLTRPEWRRSGIGTFMLYHLIQTCMGKDVTLHVSATNPALILYQKFGFKIEEFIQDFYDKYMSPDSRECRHALLLRLSR